MDRTQQLTELLSMLPVEMVQQIGAFEREPPILIEESDEDDITVEPEAEFLRIIGHSRDPDQSLWYYVEWTDGTFSWIPEENLTPDSLQAAVEYHERDQALFHTDEGFNPIDVAFDYDLHHTPVDIDPNWEQFDAILGAFVHSTTLTYLLIRWQDQSASYVAYDQVPQDLRESYRFNLD